MESAPNFGPGLGTQPDGVHPDPRSTQERKTLSGAHSKECVP